MTQPEKDITLTSDVEVTFTPGRPDCWWDEETQTWREDGDVWRWDDERGWVRLD